MGQYERSMVAVNEADFGARQYLDDDVPDKGASLAQVQGWLFQASQEQNTRVLKNRLKMLANNIDQ